MSKKNQSAVGDSERIDDDSFEFHLQQLEQIVQKLEQGQLNLSQSLECFEAGLKHLNHCQRRLGEAEARISLVTGVGPDGTPRTRKLDVAEAVEHEAPPAKKRGGRSDSSPPGRQRLF